MIKILTLVKNHFPVLLAGLLLSAVVASVSGLIAWNTGWRSGAGELADVQRDNRSLSVQVTNSEKEARTRAEQNARQLADALEQQRKDYQRAETVSAELRQVRQQLDKERKQHKLRIDDAVKNDSSAYTGIGPDSLRTWRASLGYSPDSRYLSDDPGAAAGNSAKTGSTGAGLPPADILSHGADYGAWCLTLESQLKAIGRWSRGEREHGPDD